MGIYLGQLPPAEIARLKAELAETLIAHFCYPRFFDYHTESLQMRPVDRNKRQEVWLYLSSVDFTAWGRIDLTSIDFQHQIERLFIQFVQRNRSFFGNQGRRRMSDIRMLITLCATNVVQGLRKHLSAPRQNTPPFGSPRPALSWTATPLSKHTDLTWEQISASTMTLQQQVQEWRCEPVTGAWPEENSVTAPGTAQPVAQLVSAATRATNAASSGSAVHVNVPTPRRPERMQPAPPAALATGTIDMQTEFSQQQTATTPLVNAHTVHSTYDGRDSKQASAIPQEVRPTASIASPPVPASSTTSSGVNHAPVLRSSGTGASPTEPPKATTATRNASAAVYTADTSASTPISLDSSRRSEPRSLRSRTSPLPSAATPSMQSSRTGQNGQLPTTTRSTTAREVLSMGEDDIAIFEQLRQQMLLWLRIEAVMAGLEIAQQSPTQLLDSLRQQGRLDETRLQVVSTLLNLANQVIKTGLISVLDYKQALMFHLMHTRRS